MGPDASTESPGPYRLLPPQVRSAAADASLASPPGRQTLPWQSSLLRHASASNAEWPVLCRLLIHLVAAIVHGIPDVPYLPMKASHDFDRSAPREILEPSCHFSAAGSARRSTRPPVRPVRRSAPQRCLHIERKHAAVVDRVCTPAPTELPKESRA